MSHRGKGIDPPLRRASKVVKLCAPPTPRKPASCDMRIKGNPVSSRIPNKGSLLEKKLDKVLTHGPTANLWFNIAFQKYGLTIILWVLCTQTLDTVLSTLFGGLFSDCEELINLAQTTFRPLQPQPEHRAVFGPGKYNPAGLTHLTWIAARRVGWQGVATSVKQANKQTNKQTDRHEQKQTSERKREAETRRQRQINRETQSHFFTHSQTQTHTHTHTHTKLTRLDTQATSSPTWSAPTLPSLPSLPSPRLQSSKTTCAGLQ